MAHELSVFGRDLYRYLIVDTHKVRVWISMYEPKAEIVKVKNSKWVVVKEISLDAYYIERRKVVRKNMRGGEFTTELDIMTIYSDFDFEKFKNLCYKFSL